MVMNHGYGQADEKGAVEVMEKALELGINFWDTADVYANGENERLVARMLKQNRKKVFLATKFGFIMNGPGQFTGVDGSPGYVKKAVDASLKRLDTDHIDLYYLHRLDPNIPIEETVGAMGDLVKAGKIKYIGLSEVSVNTLRRANATHPVAALQSEFSLLSREVEKEIIPACKEMGIAFIPFSPLSRGLLTNTLDVSTLHEKDFRKQLPRYQEQYKNNNALLAQALDELAKKAGYTPAQLALAWILEKGEHIIPIPGTKKVKYLVENAASVEINLSQNVLHELEELLAKYPETGSRYNPSNWKYIDRS
jgi:aryl-alcohol dehydrogenase-like predicted oxidoreductase